MAEIGRERGEWVLPCPDAGEARDLLRRFAPWRMLLKFENGPSALDFETYEPFNRWPLFKLDVILDAIETPARGFRALDIGFNCGYNALELARRHDARVVGIDVVPKHLEVARALAAHCGLDATFLEADAQDYENPGMFDLVLHLGTLYHLPNPARSIEKAARSLRPGGWFALETIRHLGEDPALCRWIYGFNGDRTNFWALGDQAIREMGLRAGLRDLRLIHETRPPVYEGRMSRAIWVGRRA